jgi:hypothetical protein
VGQAVFEQFGCDREVFEIVRRFESGELPPAEFDHRRHLTVALWYALRHDAAEVPAVMRRRLRGYLDSHGLGADVYHETLTLFWVRRVGAFLDAAGRSRSLYELANELCGAAGDSRLVKDYYSEAVIKSEAARRGWVKPDLRPLDF